VSGPVAPNTQIDEVGRDRNRFETPQPLPSQPFPVSRQYVNKADMQWASSSAWSGGMAGPPSSLSTPIPNVMTPQELKYILS
jgi:hypothetical protein